MPVADWTWDDAAVTTLCRLRDDGMGPQAIADRLGTTKNSVRSKLTRMGLRVQSGPTVKQPHLNLIRMDFRDRPMCEERRIAGADPLPAMHPISWGVLLQHTPTLRRRRA